MTVEEYNDIDNLFKSAIEPYKMEPGDKVWNSLDAELAKKQSAFIKGKNIRIRFISIVAATLVLSFLAYHYLIPAQNSDRSLKDNNTLPAHQKTKENISNNNSSIDERVNEFFGKKFVSDKTGNDKINNVVSSRSVDNKHIVNNNEREVASNAPGNQLSIISKNRDGILNDIAAHNNADSNSAGYQAGENANDNAEKAPTETRNTTSTNESAMSQSKEGSANSSTSKSSNTNAVDNSSNTSDVGDQQAGERKQEGTNMRQSESGNNTVNTGNAVENKENSSESGNTNDAPASQTNKAAIASVDSSDNSSNAALPLIPLSQIKRRFSMDAFYSPNIANNTTQNMTTDAATTSTQQFNYSFNTGAMLRFDLSDKWSISLGCTYSTLNYSTSVSTSYIVPPADSGHIGPPPPPPGWQLPHGDGDHDSSLSHNFQDTSFFQHYFPYSPSTNSFDFDNSCGSIHLHGDPTLPPPPSTSHPGDVVYFITNTRLVLQYINIPLTITFKLSNRRLDYYASTGVAMDILVKKQATINIADSYTETTSDIGGLRTICYSYMLSAGARYHLYKGLSVFMEPAYRRSITSITTGSSNSFYPYYFGLNTGISLRF